MAVAPSDFGGWPVIEEGDSPRSGYFLWTRYLGSPLGPILKVTVVLLAGLALTPFAAGAGLSVISVLVAVLLLLSPLLLIVTVYLQSFMLNNDWYTKILLLSYKILLFPRLKHPPNAKDDMQVKNIRPKQQLDLVPIAYALNIEVPRGDDEDISPATRPSFSSRFLIAFEENLHRLPYRQFSARFHPGEDPVKYAMDSVGDAYPPVRTRFTRGKLTDEGLTQLCFYGIGAHRLFREHMPSSPTASASGAWVVRTNFLAALPVREGLDSYGGDCYFDYDTWRVTKIVRRRPGRVGAFPYGQRIEEDTFTPEHPEWEYAKFVFRSSLFALITLVDHLFAIHLQIGNVVTISSREQLAADHPVRRFLLPYTFHTITVNDNARTNLINPKSMGPRNFAFTDRGTALAWAAAPSLTTSGVELKDTFATDPQQHSKLLVDFELYLDYLKAHGMETPYRVQAKQFWALTKRFVIAYLVHFYPTPEALAKDTQMTNFMMQSIERLTLVTPEHLPELTPDVLWFYTTNLLTRFCYLVTAGHEHVGTVPVYAQDVSFTAFQWPKGERCGTKQTAVTSATLMAFTSSPMPPLLAKQGSETDWKNDWTHLFEGPLTIEGQQIGEAGVVPPPVTAAWVAYQAELQQMADECDEFNKRALAPGAKFPHCFGMWQTNPRYLETALSV